MFQRATDIMMQQVMLCKFVKFEFRVIRIVCRSVWGSLRLTDSPPNYDYNYIYELILICGLHSTAQHHPRAPMKFGYIVNYRLPLFSTINYHQQII